MIGRDGIEYIESKQNPIWNLPQNASFFFHKTMGLRCIEIYSKSGSSYPILPYDRGNLPPSIKQLFDAIWGYYPDTRVLAQSPLVSDVH